MSFHPYKCPTYLAPLKLAYPPIVEFTRKRSPRRGVSTAQHWQSIEPPCLSAFLTPATGRIHTIAGLPAVHGSVSTFPRPQRKQRLTTCEKVGLEYSFPDQHSSTRS